MKGRIRLVAVAVAFALALARSARAEDWTAAERAWVRTCVTGLTSPSLRQRESAAAALVRLGPAAVPAIAAETAVLKTDDQWATLEAVLESMGRAAVVQALEASVKEWPEGTAGRRQTLIDHLKAVRVRATPTGASAEEGAEKVRQILDSFNQDASYSESDPRIFALVRLGRIGVPILLDELRQGHDHVIRRRMATFALQRLLAIDDVPALERMLDEGHYDVAPAMARLPAAVVVPLLVAPLARGINAFGLVAGLSAFKTDPRVHAALITWLDTRPDVRRTSIVGSTALLLEEAGAWAAVPSLLRVLDGTSSLNRLQVAHALVALGEKRGIPVLLEILRASPDRWNGYDRHVAGTTLNGVVGRRIYEGRSGPGLSAEGNFEQAVRQFDAWWVEVQDTIRFDSDRRVWTTK